MTDESEALSTPAAKRSVRLLKASCLCGKIQWELENVYLAQVCVCHCGMCRKLSGSMFMPFGAVARDKLWPLLAAFRALDSATDGPSSEPLLKSYQSSPSATRYFCGVCSSPMAFDYHFEPNSLWVPLGSLTVDLDPLLWDEEERDSHIFVDHRANYEDDLLQRLHKFPSYGLYKADPCQPHSQGTDSKLDCQLGWKDIPTFVSAVGGADDGSETEFSPDLRDLPGAS